MKKPKSNFVSSANDKLPKPVGRIHCDCGRSHNTMAKARKCRG